MLGGAVGDEFEVAGGGLSVAGVWAGEAAAARRGGGSRRCGCEARGVEGVREEGWGRGVHGDGVGGGEERVAGDDDVLVGGTAAFGGDDVVEVGWGELVDDADQRFVPAVFVVVWWGYCCGSSREEGGFLALRL